MGFTGVSGVCLYMCAFHMKDSWSCFHINDGRMWSRSSSMQWNGWKVKVFLESLASRRGVFVACGMMWDDVGWWNVTPLKIWKIAWIWKHLPNDWLLISLWVFLSSWQTLNTGVSSHVTSTCVNLYTLPKTSLNYNIAPKIGHPKRKVIFQPSMFRCKLAVSFISFGYMYIYIYIFIQSVGL